MANHKIQKIDAKALNILSKEIEKVEQVINTSSNEKTISEAKEIRKELQEFGDSIANNYNNFKKKHHG